MSSILGGSQSSFSSSSTPLNMQNPEYTALSPLVASGLTNLFTPTNGYEGGSSGLNPFSVNGLPSSSSQNPLVAQLTPTQNSMLGSIATYAQNPYSSGGVNFNPAATTAQMLQPGYAASLATSPQTKSAINAAINPIEASFSTQTIPQLNGQTTSAGQRVNSGNNMGSSAFGTALGNAEAAKTASELSTAGTIANTAYQTGLQQQSQAISQAQQLSSSNLGNLVNSLNASALPQMVKQYGINQGLSLYQSSLNNMLQSLGLGGQISQPAIAYNSQSNGGSSSSPGMLNPLLGGLGTAMFGK